jgi:hypothetical protein
LRKLVKEAEAEGVAFVADADAMSIRVMLKETSDGASDLRTVGEVVRVYGGCGGGTLPRLDKSGN